jgi:Family of unknown function (DUF5683)
MPPSTMRPPRTAAILSAILPGLGQFYNREWAKGAAFLVATLLIDGALGVSADMMRILLGRTAFPPPDPASLLARSLPVLAIVIWSMIDAARSAEHGVQSR